MEPILDLSAAVCFGAARNIGQCAWRDERGRTVGPMWVLDVSARRVPGRLTNEDGMMLRALRTGRAQLAGLSVG
ncbi:hypothetical protein [Pararobbsia alpina]|uniref:hypothetical protein n=1 Tax=Pararobbsia alpina TaxID=621374 RepID=UPI0039A4605E